VIPAGEELEKTRSDFVPGHAVVRVKSSWD